MYTLQFKGKQLAITQPVVMGIVNTTPDSFYSNSRVQQIDDALFTVEKMLREGATLIDIGGQSTRPNSPQITPEEELQRVLPVIDAVHQNFPQAHISIDTYYAQVAAKAIAAGAMMVNDISGGTMDAAMLPTVAQLQVPYVCMHIQGTPQTMLQQTNYTNVVQDVYKYFEERIATANSLGVGQIILDIGFGFAKNTRQNFELLKNLSHFNTLQKPLLVGVSRKSSIYKTLNTTPQQALNGTTVLNTIALLNGAAILRVHDVKEAVEAIQLCTYFS